MIKIAVADDHYIVREGIASLLGKMGYPVIIQANDGAELIHRLERAKELPHICMVDINMPNMDGFATTEVIKARWPQIKVLAVTQHAEELYLVRMIHAGAKGYITKDSTAEKYRDAILSLYHRRVYFSEKGTELFMHAAADGKLEHPKLTATEVDILRLCCAEHTTQEIADALGVSFKVVENHKAAILRKMHVKTSVGMAIAAVKYGYVLVDGGPSPVG